MATSNQYTGRETLIGAESLDDESKVRLWRASHTGVHNLTSMRGARNLGYQRMINKLLKSLHSSPPREIGEDGLLRKIRSSEAYFSQSDRCDSVIVADAVRGGTARALGDHVKTDHGVKAGIKSKSASKSKAGIAGAVTTAALLLSCSPAALHAETSNAELAAEIKALKAQIREMRTAISETRTETRRTQAKVRAVATRTPAPGYAPPPPAYAAIPAGAVPAFVTADKKLQFGAITITPGGFLAGESVFRTRTVNGDVNTPFGAIPFPNSPLAHLNEFRPSARQSRMALLAEGAITPTFIAAGYAEFDFLGAAPTANSNQTNSYTPRIRNLYATLDNSDYGMHVLAGQNWSLVTLNSKGITPRNEVTPTVIDAAQSVGSIYARQPQIRLTKDFGRKLWLSISAEESETTFSPGCATPSANNPTGAGTSLTPAAANGGIAPPATPGNTVTNITCGVVGAGAFSSGTNYSLNHVPDVIGKAAYEARFADRDIHLEAMGLYTNLYDRVAYTSATGLPGASNKDTSGYGVGGGTIVAVIPKRLDFQFNALYGRGIGRYAPGGLAESTFNPDGSLKALPELIALAGLTLHATPSIDIYAYGGVETTVRSYFQNPTVGGVAGTFVGVGSPATVDTTCRVEGSAAGTCNGTTKTLWQGTLGFWDKIYKGSFGEVRAGVQYSYVKREIFNAPGAAMSNPKTDDHLIFTSMRYFPFQ